MPRPSTRSSAAAPAVRSVVASSLAPPWIKPYVGLDHGNRLRVMARGGVVGPHRDQGWGPVDAQLTLAVGQRREPLASSTEPATRWRIGGTGQVALQDDALPAALLVRVRD